MPLSTTNAISTAHCKGLLFWKSSQEAQEDLTKNPGSEHSDNYYENYVCSDPGYWLIHKESILSVYYLLAVTTLAVTTKSTRRFIARPSLVSLEAIGLDSP